jgi:hypothetical protein
MSEHLNDLSARISELQERYGATAERNAELEREVLELKQERATTPLTRRSVLRTGTVAAAGAVAGLVALRPAAVSASTGAMQYGVSNAAGTDTTALTSTSADTTLQVANAGGNGGVALEVVQDGLTGAAINAVTTAGGGTSPVVLATQNGDGAVLEGHSSNTTATVALARLTHHGLGRVVSAVISNSTSAATVVYASTNGTGDAVRAKTSGMGRAGVFEGGVAQVRLVPSAIGPTHPITGARGDLFCDKFGSLWFCKGATTWVKLA